MNMHPIIKILLALSIMLYCTLTEKKWLHQQGRKSEDNSHHLNTKWN